MSQRFGSFNRNTVLSGDRKSEVLRLAASEEVLKKGSIRIQVS